MHDIQEQVADDQVHQWMVVVEDPHHTMADACVHYDLVIAAYLQAGDDAKYHEWMKNKAKGCDEGTQ